MTAWGKFFVCGALLVWAGLPAAAQTATVPCPYSDLYTSMQGQIASFDNTVSSQWSGARPPVAFSGELLKANANLGRHLLSTAAFQNAVLELSRLQALGVKAVTVNIGFPVLLPSFFQWNGDPGDYNIFLNFYKQLAAEVRRRGLQLIVKSNPLFTPRMAPWSCNPVASGLNVAGYYPTLTNAQYVYNRAQVILTIAKQIKPDYLSMATEPDTEATLTGKSFVSTPTGYAQMVSYILSQLNAAGVTGIPLGAGFGTWLPNGASYVQALAGTGLHYIDLHVYPVSFNWLNNTITLAAQAQTLGKEVALSEGWLMKERDSEFSTIDSLTDCSIMARDAFSFWAPLDQQFLNAMVKVSYWKQVQFFSAYWTKYFYAYLDYNQVSSQTPQQIFALSDSTSQTAMSGGQFTGTARAYQAAIGNAAAADFQVYATPSCQSATAGGSAAYSVDAMYTGYSGIVTLSVTGLPAGATATFSAGSIRSGSAASTLTISAGAATLPGTYILSISGTGGSLVRSTPVNLTVVGPAVRR